MIHHHSIQSFKFQFISLQIVCAIVYLFSSATFKEFELNNVKLNNCKEDIQMMNKNELNILIMNCRLIKDIYKKFLLIDILRSKDIYIALLQVTFLIEKDVYS